jgi:hypothetical protein
MTAAASRDAGWLTDPTTRHELRYWDGRAWTEHVADKGVQALDSPAILPPPPPAVPAPTQVPAKRATGAGLVWLDRLLRHDHDDKAVGWVIDILITWLLGTAPAGIIAAAVLNGSQREDGTTPMSAVYFAGICFVGCVAACIIGLRKWRARAQSKYISDAV